MPRTVWQKHQLTRGIVMTLQPWPQTVPVPHTDSQVVDQQSIKIYRPGKAGSPRCSSEQYFVLQDTPGLYRPGGMVGYRIKGRGSARAWGPVSAL